MRTTSSRGVVVSRIVAGATLVALLVAACANGSSGRDAAIAANEAQVDGGGWDMLAMQADEVERFDTLAEMGQIADFVLIAQATGVDGVRRVGPEGDEGIDLAQVRFEVVRAIGDWNKDSIVLEFFIPTPQALKALEEQVAGFPPTVLAVRDKGAGDPEEEGLYRLVNSESLWTAQPDGGLVAPLAEDHSDREFASELADVKDLEELGDHLEAARRGCDGECGLSQAAWNR